MMEVLKRFEEEAVEDADELLMPDEEDEEDDLTSRMSNVDLGEYQLTSFSTPILKMS